MKSLLLKLLGISQTIWSFILPLLSSAATTLLPYAEQYALAVATSALTGEDKKAAVMAQLKTAAVAAGVTATTSLLDTLTQVAVTKLKANGSIQ